MLCCCCRHREVRMNHSDARNNTLKLIWGVVQFAKKNKEHIFRSAFTYNEMPSRLDLAKQRYGGPFTTREVEDVKNFWQQFFLLSSLIGFQLRDDTTLLSIAAEWNLPSSISFLGLNYSSWTVTSLWLLCVFLFTNLSYVHFSQVYSQNAHKDEDRSGHGTFVLDCYNCDQWNSFQFSGIWEQNYLWF